MIFEQDGWMIRRKRVDQRLYLGRTGSRVWHNGDLADTHDNVWRNGRDRILGIDIRKA